MLKKTVDSVVKGFSKMINDLDKILKDNAELNLKRDEEIIRMQDAQRITAKESVRAERIIGKLKEIVGE